MAYLSPSMQACNKETTSFTSYDDLFEHFVDSDSYGLSDNTTDRSTSDEWEKYFDLPESFSGSDTIALSPQLDGLRSPDFGKALWADAELSDDDIFSNLLDFSTSDCKRSSSPPSPSTADNRQRPSKHSKHLSLDLNKSRSGGIRKSSQRDSVSPRMAQPSVCRGRDQDTWAQKIEANVDKFDFSSHHHLRSPPPSAPLPQMSWNNSNFQQNAHTRVASYHPSSKSILDELSLPAHAHFTPLSSPILDTQVGPGTSYVQSPTTSFFNESFTSPMIDWTFANQDSDLTYQDAITYGTEAGLFSLVGFPTTTSPEAASGFRSAALSPASPNHGLMINCNIAANGSIDPASHHSSRSQSDTTRRFTSTTRQHQPPQTASHRSSYQSIPSHAQRGMRPLTPPASPRSRKGSRGPTTNHRRSKTTTGINERRLHAAAFGAGFVNYTPDDSRKILGGVAPSGSSKTKARREKEAADKRQKLSLAAAKAVMEAGGDVEQLRRCGLLA